ncbi:MAG: 50S ribosomal protein L18e [Candidatus Bathyarchaeia archaeon]
MKRYITNKERVKLAKLLRKTAREHKCTLWRHVADRLEASTRQRLAVNLSRINRYTDGNDVAVVAGKALSEGEISHPVTVAAFAFSQRVRDKILKAGGRCVTLEELLAENPSGSNVRLIG